MLVPSAVAAGDAQNSVAVAAFGSIGRSCYTLVSSMAGGTEWGIHLVYPLLEEDAGIGSIFLLGTLLIASLVLVVVVGGLVTGVFLERVLYLSKQIEDAEKQEEMRVLQESLDNLANAFADHGFAREDHITWPDVTRIMQEYPKVWVEIKVAESDAKSMFAQLQELDHFTYLDEFLLGLFTLRSMSKSIDMQSIDYEQEKALQKVSELRNNMRMTAAIFQSRLHSVIMLLQSLEQEVEIVQKGIAGIQELEKELSELQDENTAALSGVPKVSKVVQQRKGSPQLSASELMADEELNRRLCELEQELAQLSIETPSDTPSDLDEDIVAMSEVAVEVVESFQQMLHVELEQAVEGVGCRPASPSLPRHIAEDALVLPRRHSDAGSASYLWRALHDPTVGP